MIIISNDDHRCWIIPAAIIASKSNSIGVSPFVTFSPLTTQHVSAVPAKLTVSIPTMDQHFNIVNQC